MAPGQRNNDDDEEHRTASLADSVARGFRKVGEEIASLRAEAKTEMDQLAGEITQLKTRLEPVYAAFTFGTPNNVNDRMIRLEERLRVAESDVASFKSRLLTVWLGLTGALVGVVWAIIQNALHLTK